MCPFAWVCAGYLPESILPWPGVEVSLSRGCDGYKHKSTFCQQPKRSTASSTMKVPTMTTSCRLSIYHYRISGAKYAQDVIHYVGLIVVWWQFTGDSTRLGAWLLNPNVFIHYAPFKLWCSLLEWVATFIKSYRNHMDFVLGRLTGGHLPSVVQSDSRMCLDGSWCHGGSELCCVIVMTYHISVASRIPIPCS